MHVCLFCDQQSCAFDCQIFYYPRLKLFLNLNFSNLEQIAAIPQFSHLGPLFRSSQPVELTEAVTEYTVSMIKHTFNENILLQVGFCI